MPHANAHRTRALSFAALLAIAPACSGKIGEPGPADPRATPVDPGDPTRPPGSSDPTRPIPPFSPAPAALHRLTRAQYGNSLRALFGDVRVPTDLEVDTSLYGFTTVGAASLSIGPRAAEQYEAAALDVAAQVFADDTARTTLVGCAPAVIDDPCVRTFFASFGRRAWRRPLTTEELDRWTGVAATIATAQRSVWTGLELAVAGMLQSPHFLYRVETGVPDPSDATRHRYDGFELASRLSFFLWNGPPDDALLDAAARGDLDTKDGVRAEAVRLLAAPQAERALVAFFDEHFKLDRLEGLTKDAATFPQLTPTLGASMRAELRHAFERVLEEGVDLRTLFDGRETRVNAELARIYGLGVEADGFVPVTHAEGGARAGILTTAGFLALNAHASATSPTLRGRFIRQSLLCQEIPPPPPGVDTTIPEAQAHEERQTLRQRLETLHHENPTCAGCHLRMDPLGFALESFDAIGAYRTTDNGLPVDPRGELDGKTFKSARELSTILRDHEALGPCLSRMAYRYATGHLETTGETATLVELAKALTDNGYRFRELVLAIVTSDGFRFAAATE